MQHLSHRKSISRPPSSCNTSSNSSSRNPPVSMSAAARAGGGGGGSSQPTTSRKQDMSSNQWQQQSSNKQSRSRTFQTEHLPVAQLPENEISLNLSFTASNQPINSTTSPLFVRRQAAARAFTTVNSGFPSTEKQQPQQQFFNPAVISKDQNELFGFIKQDNLFASGRGSLNSDLYKTSLNKFARQRSTALTSPDRPRSSSVLAVMEQHIEATNRLQRRFVEQSVISAWKSTSQEKQQPNLQSDKMTTDNSAVIVKLNQHLNYQRDRKEINQLIKEAMLKSNYNPNHDAIELSSLEEDHMYSNNKSKSPFGSKLQRKHQVTREESMVMVGVEEELTQGEDNEEDDIPPPQGLAFVGAAAASMAKKKNNERNESALMEAHLQSTLNERRHRKKMKAIMSNHAKNIREMEYVYSDVTEETKKLELAKRQKKLEQLQQEYLLRKIQQSPATASPQQQQQQQNTTNARNNWKNLTGFVRNNVRSLTTAAGVPLRKTSNASSSNFEGESFVSKPNNNKNNSKNKKGNGALSSQSSMNSVGWDKLELQKQEAKENASRLQDEAKLFFEPQYKQRMKEIQLDLQKEGCKEAVLDRVIMNYFHQEDLLKEQRELFKKQIALLPKRSGGGGSSSSNSTSTSSTGIPSANSQGNVMSSSKAATRSKNRELSDMLRQFDPNQLRLKLKDVKTQQQQRNRSRSREANAEVNSYEPNNNYMRSYTDANVDIDVFKEDFTWKKKQNELINFSKVCSPALMVRQFMHDDPAFKKQENIEMIDYLVQIDPASEGFAIDDEGEEGAEIKEDVGDRMGSNEGAGFQSQKQTESAQNEVLRRCFFKFSNKMETATAQRYSVITFEGFLQLFYILSGKDISVIEKEFLLPGESSRLAENIEVSPANGIEAGQSQQQQALSQNDKEQRFSFFARIMKEQRRQQRQEDLKEKMRIEQKEREDKLLQMKLLGEWVTVEVVKSIFEKISRGQDEPTELSYFSFLQALRKAAVIYYLSGDEGQQEQEDQHLQSVRVSNDDSDEDEEEKYLNSKLSVSARTRAAQTNQQQRFFDRFYEQFIQPQSIKFRDAAELEILAMRVEPSINVLLRAFEANLRDLFKFAGSMRNSRIAASAEYSQTYLSFQEYFEIIAKLDLFPDKISKNIVRYVYYYALTNEKGLTFSDFCVCMNLIALQIMRGKQTTPVVVAPKDDDSTSNATEDTTLMSKKKIQAQRDKQAVLLKSKEVQLALSKVNSKKKKGNKNNEMNLIIASQAKFIEDIGGFYLNEQYIDINHMHHRIFLIKEAVQKTMQFF